MMATARRVSHLSQKALESKYRIAELIQETALEVDNALAWGQFLDAPRQANQYGIYGTAAAIEILASAGNTEENPLIRNSLSALPEILPLPARKSIYDSSDIEVLFKLCALLEAAQPGMSEMQEVEPAEKTARSRIIDGRGWGYYYSEQERDTSPRFLATVQAMYSLRRSRDFRLSKDCEKVLSWVCRELLADGDLQPDELALAILVLAEYAATGHSLPDYTVAQERAIRRLAKWATTRKPGVIGENRSYHYPVRRKEIQRNQYIFYPTDILTALAFIRADSPVATREYVLDVVEYANDNIKLNGGLRARSTHRIATVDQLWCSRLLGAFHESAKASPRDLLPPLAQVISHNQTRRVVTGVVLLVLGILGTTLSVISDWPTAWRVAGGVTGALMLGVLATALWKWIGGK